MPSERRAAGTPRTANGKKLAPGITLGLPSRNQAMAPLATGAAKRARALSGHHLDHLGGRDRIGERHRWIGEKPRPERQREHDSEKAERAPPEKEHPTRIVVSERIERGK